MEGDNTKYTCNKNTPPHPDDPQMSDFPVYICFNQMPANSSLFQYRSAETAYTASLPDQEDNLTYLPPGENKEIIVTFDKDISSYDVTGMSFSFVADGDDRNHQGNIIDLSPIAAIDNNSVKIRYAGGPQGKYQFIASLNAEESVVTKNVGFTNIIRVDSLSPNEGSVLGGTIISIEGRNFLPNINSNQKVFIGGMLVESEIIISTSSTTIKLKTPEPTPNLIGKPLSISVVHNEIYYSESVGSIFFEYKNSETPKIERLRDCEKIYSNQNDDKVTACYIIPKESNSISDEYIFGIEGNDIKTASYSEDTLYYKGIGQFRTIDVDLTPENSDYYDKTIFFYLESSDPGISGLVPFPFQTNVGIAEVKQVPQSFCL